MKTNPFAVPAADGKSRFPQSRVAPWRASTRSLARQTQAAVLAATSSMRTGRQIHPCIIGLTRSGSVMGARAKLKSARDPRAPSGGSPDGFVTVPVGSLRRVAQKHASRVRSPADRSCSGSSTFQSAAGDARETFQGPSSRVRSPFVSPTRSSKSFSDLKARARRCLTSSSACSCRNPFTQNPKRTLVRLDRATPFRFRYARPAASGCHVGAHPSQLSPEHKTPSADCSTSWHKIPPRDAFR